MLAVRHDVEETEGSRKVGNGDRSPTKIDKPLAGMQVLDLGWVWSAPPKLRGIQWIYSGVDWEWYKPIRHRDRFTTKVQLIDAVEKSGSNAKRFIVQTGESLYYNHDGELVCRARAAPRGSRAPARRVGSIASRARRTAIRRKN